LQNI